MFLNIKRNIFYFMLHLPALWYFDTSVTYPNDFVESNLLQYHHVLYSSNICEILLYNRQWVVCHELICGVWAARRKGKLFVKKALWDYSINRCSHVVQHLRISGIIPWEIIFWYREIINFSVSGIDFSSLHQEITLAKSDAFALLYGELVPMVHSPCRPSHWWGRLTHHSSNKKVRECQ